MKLSIEFDSTDFKSMLVDFFVQAGYDISPSSLEAAETSFESSFPNGVLSLTVTPAQNPINTNALVEKDGPVVNTLGLREMPMPPEEDAILPFSKIMDPEYQEVAELQSILNLSKTLEKPAK